MSIIVNVTLQNRVTTLQWTTSYQNDSSTHAMFSLLRNQLNIQHFSSPYTFTKSNLAKIKTAYHIPFQDTAIHILDDNLVFYTTNLQNHSCYTHNCHEP